MIKIHRIISWFFSSEFSNKRATSNNVIQQCLYKAAYRPSKFFVSIKVSANQVTTLSLIFGIASFAAIGFYNSKNLFFIFWGISLFLDYCDGTVARMNCAPSKNSFRYDHISDIFKFAINLYGIALYFDSKWIWSMTVIVIFAFMMVQILGHDIESAKKNYAGQTIKVDCSELLIVDFSRRRVRDKYIFVKLILELFPWVKDFYENTRNQVESIFFNLNGHTLILVLLLPLSFSIAMGVYVYLLFLCIRYVHSFIKELLVIPR